MGGRGRKSKLYCSLFLSKLFSPCRHSRLILANFRWVYSPNLDSWNPTLPWKTERPKHDASTPRATCSEFSMAMLDRPALKQPAKDYFRYYIGTSRASVALWARITKNPDTALGQWATHLSVRLFARTTHSFACSALLTLLARSDLFKNATR